MFCLLYLLTVMFSFLWLVLGLCCCMWAFSSCGAVPLPCSGLGSVAGAPQAWLSLYVESSKTRN